MLRARKDDKVVRVAVGVVTGGGRGMGEACAARLAADVDVLLLADRDTDLVHAAAERLAPTTDAHIEPHVLDVTDEAALSRLADRVAELGRLRSCVHAAGVSPAMAGWERVLAVDLVGTALFVEALRPHVTSGTALVCFASMAPYLDPSEPNPAAEAVLDQPFAADLVARLHATVGESLEDPSMATCGPSGESIAWYDAKPSRSAHEVRASARSRPVSSTRRWDGKKSRRDR